MRCHSRMLMVAALILSTGQALGADDGSRTGDVVKLAVLEPFTSEATAPDMRTRVALLCFLTGEYISGLNRICLYDCLGSQAAITVSSAQLCPLSINR